MGIDRPRAWPAATLIVLAACSGGGASPTQTSSIVSVAIRPSLTTLTAGQVQQFHAVAQDANGDSLPVADFQWAAAPSAIASVTASGTVTVAGVGAFVLTATTNGSTGRDTILAKVDSIHISPSVDTVVADSGAGQLTAQGFGVTGAAVPNLAPSSFTWTSATPATATVSTGGSVSGLQIGGPVTITASLSAALGGGQGTAHVVVRQPVVAHVAFVVIAPAVDTTTVADTFTFTATTKDSVGNPLTGRVIAWTSSDTTIAVIDAVTGQALIKATGSATITATSEGKQGTATIYGRVPWKVLSAGLDFVCGVTTGDVAYCWGLNGNGQLGNGTTDGPAQCLGLPMCSPTPVAVAAPTSGSPLALNSVSAGGSAACGITFDSQALYCWGVSLSWGSTAVSPTPTAVGPWPYNIAPTSTITGVVVGGFSACAIKSGTVVCFGYNLGGNIGNGQVADVSLPPTVTMTKGDSSQASGPIVVPSGANVLATSGTTPVSCALQSGAAMVWCWGYNKYGQTGDATSNAFDPLAYPVVFPPMSSSDPPIQVAVGSEATCTLLADGSVYCWGTNASGEYGNGTEGHTVPDSITPTQAQVPVPLTTISLGALTVCGLDKHGTAWCWGETPGSSGESFALQPTPVTAPVAFTNLTTYSDLVCALDAVGTAYCWGSNSHGELGNGTQTTSTTPVRVAAPVTPGQPLGSALVARVRAQRLRLASAARQHASGRTVPSQRTVEAIARRCPRHCPHLAVAVHLMCRVIASTSVRPRWLDVTP